MKIIRWNFLIPAAVVVAAITVFNIMFFDVILKKALISSGEMIFGAKVEIDSLKTSFTSVSLSIEGLRCADRNDYFKNLIDVGHLKFDAKFTPLLRKKLVIDEMTVTGLKWGTERKTSGKLPPKKEKKFDKKQKKESKFSKLFDSAKNKAAAEVNALPAVNAFSEIESQMKSFDAEKLLDKSNLQSVKEIEKLSADMQNKYKNYETAFNNLKIDEKIRNTKALVEEVSKTKFSGLSDVSSSLKKVQELKNNKKEFDDILKQLDAAKKDVAAGLNISSQIQDAVNKDVNSAVSKLSIPGLNTKGISNMLFGRKWVNRIDKVIYYMSLVKKYMPEKTDKQKEPVRQRQKGRDIIFAQKNYPSLLISKINISGTASENGQTGAIDFSGFIKNVSSSPDMVSEPITLEIKGDNGSQRLAVEGVFDHRGTKSEDVLTVKVSGVSGRVLNVPESDYLPLIGTAVVKISADFKLINDGFFCGAAVDLSGIKEKNLNDIGGNMKYIAEVTNTVKAFAVKASAKSENGGDLDFDVTSDIDDKISSAVSKLFSSKIGQAKAKIKEEINKITAEQIKTAENGLQGQKDALLKNINSQTGVIQDIEKSVSDAVSKQTKLKLF